MGQWWAACTPFSPSEVGVSLGLGIGYNLAVMGLGGFAQFFVTGLITATGSTIARTLDAMSGTAIDLMAVYFWGTVYAVAAAGGRYRDNLAAE